MKLRTRDIPSSGLEYHFTPKTGELNQSLADILGDVPQFDVRLSINLNDDILNVSGLAKATLLHQCSRCAESFQAPVEKKFLASFCLDADGFKGALPEDFSDPEQHFDVDFLSSDSIDLSDTVHEQLALEIPFQPLCAEECMGLCSQCGSNLNEGACQCSSKTVQIRPSAFNALKSLKL